MSNHKYKLEGIKAFNDGQSMDDCPYEDTYWSKGWSDPEYQKFRYWRSGFNDAEVQYNEKQRKQDIAKLCKKLDISQQDLVLLKKFILKDLKEGQVYYEGE